MIASGLPKRNAKRHIQEVADCALDILASVSTFCIPHQPEKKVRIRIGKFVLKLYDQIDLYYMLQKCLSDFDI